MKSKNWTIRNLLLFKKNEPLDSLVAEESERLIRKQRYVRSVIIKPVEIPNCKDSVDISVRVLDSWSLIPTGAISSSRGNFEITERISIENTIKPILLNLGDDFYKDTRVGYNLKVYQTILHGTFYIFFKTWIEILYKPQNIIISLIAIIKSI